MAVWCTRSLRINEFQKCCYYCYFIPWWIKIIYSVIEFIVEQWRCCFGEKGNKIGWQKLKTLSMMLLLCYALTMVEIQQICVKFYLKTHVLKWDLRARSAFLPCSKSVNVTKMKKVNKNWKNVSECVSEKKRHFTKTIVLPVDKTKAFEILQIERILNAYYNTLVSNISNAGGCFSKSTNKKIWKL